MNCPWECFSYISRIDLVAVLLVLGMYVSSSLTSIMLGGCGDGGMEPAVDEGG